MLQFAFIVASTIIEVTFGHFANNLVSFYDPSVWAFCFGTTIILSLIVVEIFERVTGRRVFKTIPGKQQNKQRYVVPSFARRFRSSLHAQWGGLSSEAIVGLDRASRAFLATSDASERKEIVTRQLAELNRRRKASEGMLVASDVEKMFLSKRRRTVWIYVDPRKSIDSQLRFQIFKSSFSLTMWIAQIGSPSASGLTVYEIVGTDNNEQ
jgi:hypothetical protein